MTMKKCIIFLILCLIIPCSVYSNEQHFRVAVLGVSGRNVPEYEAKMLRDYLELALFKNKKFTVLERKQIKVIFREQNIKTGKCISTTCFVKMGQALSADYIVNGSLNKSDNKYHIVIKVISVSSSKLVYMDSISLEQEKEIKTEDMKQITEFISKKVSKEMIEKIQPEDSYNFYVSTSFNYLIPHRVLSSINKNGYGFSVGAGIQMSIIGTFAYIILGVNSGYYYFQAEKSFDELSVIPVALDFNMQFKFNNYLYCSPGFDAGIELLKFAGKSYEPDFFLKPSFGFGLALDSFSIYTEISYAFLFEKDGLLSRIDFGAGIIYYL